MTRGKRFLYLGLTPFIRLTIACCLLATLVGSCRVANASVQRASARRAYEQLRTQMSGVLLAGTTKEQVLASLRERHLPYLDWGHPEEGFMSPEVSVLIEEWDHPLWGVQRVHLGLNFRDNTLVGWGPWYQFVLS